MSTLNVANLELQIVRKIANTTNNKELAILNKALYVLQTGVIFTVGTFANLPSASDNVGKLYFVEADSLLYFGFVGEYASLAQWIPITNVSVNTLWTWGNGSGGTLGNGTATSRCSPGTIVGENYSWCDITGGDFFSALKTDGTLWTWGSNSSGRLGDGTIVARCSPGTVAGGGTTWCQVSAGAFGVGAIKTDGTLWTWGANFCGVLGDGTTVSRCSPGTVAGGGTNWCFSARGGNNIGEVSLGIKIDGTLWTWGHNVSGVLGDGTTVSRCSPGTVAGGGTTWCSAGLGCVHVAAIKTDGTLWTWGSNGSGRLGDGTTVSRCSPGTVAGGGTTWCQASGSTTTSSSFFAIKTDGTLWAWGSNGSGILGDGTTVDRCSPVTVAGGGTTWCQVSNGLYGASAVKTDGTLWTWGLNNSNRSGRLGDGTILNRCSPGTVAGGGTTWFKTAGQVFVTAAITKETL